MTSRPRIGVLGGTLDPIHVGHLETAAAAARALALDRVVVMPSHVPPHRNERPMASPFHRFAMAALSVNGRHGMVVSDAELTAPGPSYTSSTLDRLRSRGFASTQIFFITGADAFAEIDTWYRFPDVLDLAHFAVVSRPGCNVGVLPGLLPALRARMIAVPADAAAFTKPAVFLIDAATPDVSSTEIRRRLRAGEPITGLVPPPIEEHIRRHNLYVTADHLHGSD
jgi:nicotinate-nucleotide adenylyltransferase